MRAVVQRVARASVGVEGETIARIGPGLVVLLAVSRDDREQEAGRLAAKLADLRIFENDQGKFDRSLRDIGGEALIISQFTLYGDTRKGRRPSFAAAAEPARAEHLYSYLVDRIAELGISTQRGRFGAHMKVDLVNDGPVTLVVDVDAAEAQ